MYPRKAFKTQYNFTLVEVFLKFFTVPPWFPLSKADWLVKQSRSCWSSLLQFWHLQTRCSGQAFCMSTVASFSQHQQNANTHCIKESASTPPPPHTHCFREVRNISAGSCYSIHLRLQFRYQLLLLRMFLRGNNRQERVRWFKEHEIP